MNSSADHFDKFAKRYDYYKTKNWYYYDNLKKLYRELIPDNKKVLDIGCGTGDILASVNPQHGLGIDASQEMVRVAQKKYSDNKNLEFKWGVAENLADDLSAQNFDYIFMADLIEHLENVPKTIKKIGQISKSNTKTIISMANPLWEPILLILEKLNLKMAEGPHKRISIKELESILSENNFKILEKNYRLILPISIPLISDLINRYFYRIPILRNLGLIFFIKLSKNV